MSGIAKFTMRPLSRLVGITASGVIGAVIVDGLRSSQARRAARSGAVTVTAWGLLAQHKAEIKAEELRLGFGDIVAEARERVGDEAKPPTDVSGHDHDH
ncbi:MAG: DUF1490 family protein [Microlunatus sp.]